MVRADWGLDEPGLHLPGTHGDCETVLSDNPSAITSVRTARELGFEPLHESPMWTFLPAVWPVHARAWARDTRVRHMAVTHGSGPTRQVPWATADYAEMEMSANLLLAECGIPPRPAGRIWLLRPPPSSPSLQDVLDELTDDADSAGLRLMASPEFVSLVSEGLRRRFPRD